MSFRAFAFALAAIGGVALAAQSPKFAFEAASVKPNVSRSFPVGPEARPGGAFVATNITLESNVRFAYNIRAYQLVGGPDWMRTERFDIDARAGRDASPEEIRRMVQALLEDRFQLVIRREQREMPTYALLPARSDQRLGSNLRQSAADCVRPDGRGDTLEERRTVNGGVETRRTCTLMAALVSSLSDAVQAPVDDRTGLAGRWDYELSFTGERRRNVDAATAARDPNDAPALFTAVQEQLGLKLEAGRGRVDVVVIESAARPAEN
jgi:uncharacterized protein (TIGR03435 family)